MLRSLSGNHHGTPTTVISEVKAPTKAMAKLTPMGIELILRGTIQLILKVITVRVVIITTVVGDPITVAIMIEVDPITLTNPKANKMVL